MIFLDTYGNRILKPDKEVVYADGCIRIVRCNKCMSYYVQNLNYSFSPNGDCPYCKSSENCMNKIGTHQKYGKLRSIASLRIKGKNKCGLFKCDCGSKLIRDYSCVFQGYSLSCGCLEDKYNFEFKGVVDDLVYTNAELSENDALIYNYVLDILKSRPERRPIQDKFNSSPANIFSTILSDKSAEDTKKEDEVETTSKDLNTETSDSTSDTTEEELSKPVSKLEDKLLVSTDLDKNFFTSVFNLLSKEKILSFATRKDIFDIMLLYGDTVKTLGLCDELKKTNIVGESESLYVLRLNDRLVGCISLTDTGYVSHGEEVGSCLSGLQSELTKCIKGYINTFDEKQKRVIMNCQKV